LIVGLIWATARVLGAYGEAARELDINFLFGFLLTTGGWAAVFLIIDRVAKFLGWKRPPPATEVAEAATARGMESPPSLTTVERPATPVERSATPARRRSSRRPRR
jgi:hypothetical protein